MNPNLSALVSALLLYGREFVIKNSDSSILYCSSNYNDLACNANKMEKNIYRYGNRYYESDRKNMVNQNQFYIIESFYDITRFHKKIEELKEDKMTKLANRNTIDTFLKEDNNLQNSLFVLCDIDDFKRINDTFGHQAGDNVLSKIGAAFKRYIRVEDFAGRYGGEEFLLIFRTTNLHLVKKRLNKVRKEISEVCNLTNQVYFSAGIALYDGTKTKEETIHYADKALYYVKENGKNNDAFYDFKEDTINLINI